MKKKFKRRIRTIRFALRKHAFSALTLGKYNPLIWKLLNRTAISSFHTNKPTLTNLQQSIVNDLRTDGIAVTSLSELYPDENILDDLLTYVEKRSDRTRTNRKKPFLEDMLSEIPELGVEIPFFTVATHPTTLNIVNTYLGLHSQLYHFMLRRTKLSGINLPSHSQNWHRAPQERKNCRMYIYLSDVDNDSGPFMYIPQSTHNKRYEHIAPQTAFSRGYNSSEVVQQKVPYSDITTVTGKAGTVIFCDSTGLHRGGYSNQNTRTMSTFGYGAPSLRENIHYSYPHHLYKKLQSEAATQKILNPKWQR